VRSNVTKARKETRALRGAERRGLLLPRAELVLEGDDAILRIREALLETPVDPALIVQLADEQRAPVDQSDDGFLV
jgi:hypothetical protein